MKYLLRLIALLLMASALSAVAQSPVFTSPPEARQVVVSGQNLTLTAPVTGAAAYQWKRNGRGIAGASSANYTITGAQVARDSGWYQLVATNASGPTTSAVIFVIVRPQVSHIEAWGDSFNGALTIPAGLTDVVKIATRSDNSVALRADGTLVNLNGFGPPDGLSGIVDIKGGNLASMALKSDGTVVAWSIYPGYTVPSGVDHVVAIAAGENHMLALRSDGAVVAWGSDTVATAVPAGLNNVVAISAGSGFSLAVKSDGTVVGWGANGNLQSTPPAGLSNVTAVAGGWLHSLALKSDGSIVGWPAGQLATTIPPGLSNVESIVAGNALSGAVTPGGNVTMWGANNSGVTDPRHLGPILQLSTPIGRSFVMALREAVYDVVPSILIQPVGGAALADQDVTFAVTANGGPSLLAYQWKKDGTPIVGATNQTLVLPRSTASDAGSYTVVVSNWLGSVTSNAATLTLLAAPLITSASSATFASGVASSFTVTASGTPAPTFTIVAGNLPAWVVFNSATGVIAGTPPNDDGSPYTAVIRASNGVGTADQAFTLSVSPSPRLANLSVLTPLTTAGLSSTFTVTGSGTKSVLIRAVGPSLAMFGINGTVADPQISVSQSSTGAVVAANDNWGGSVRLYTAFAAVGAFALDASSKDAAVAATLVPGTYAVDCKGVGGATGQVLLEIYDIPTSGETAKLTYLALRAPASGPVTVGFIVSGSGAIPVLARAVGPSLIDDSAMTDPRLTLFNGGSAVIGANDNWGTASPDVTSAVTQTGASPFISPTSRDAALVQTIAPGSYSMQVESTIGASGTVLIEVFDVGAAAPPQAPWFVTSPKSLTASIGDILLYSVVAGGTRPVSYQWRKNGVAIPGATGAGVQLPSGGTVTAADAGVYDVVATNAAGTGVSAPATVSVAVPAPPTIISQPVSTSAFVGQTVSFSVGTSFIGTISYQWQKDGQSIANATTAGLTLTNVQLTAVGAYTVIASNAGGSVTSNVATLTVTVPIPPTITTQPVSATLNPGDVASFRVTATGSAPFTYQWRRNGAGISGATSSFYILGKAQFSQTGNYDVVITNPGGTVTSQLAALNLSSTDLAIAVQPAALIGAVGVAATFSVTASGLAPFTYQWRKDGASISGATNSSYTIGSAQAGDAGGYSVVITNSVGILTSRTVALQLVSGPPSFVLQPFPATVAIGGSANFTVSVGSSLGVTYQWRRNAVVIPGATNSFFSITNAQSGNAGDYDVVVTNPAGSVASAVAHLTVVPRLISLSVRMTIGSEGAVGVFTVEGTASKLLLIRAVGPGLIPLGVTGVVPDPQLEIYNSDGTLIAINNDWWTSNAEGVAGVTAMVGGFALANGGRDSAVLMNFAPGSYTVRATGATGVGGIAYLELFDADTQPVASTLPFFAARGRMSAGDGVVVGGLSSNGRGVRNFLLRAIGPTLGVANALSDPTLAAAREGQPVGSNDNWDTFTFEASAITAATNRVAAFPLPAGSHDAAMVLSGNLHTGAHTALIGAPVGVSGLALIELHDVDNARPNSFAPIIVSPPISQNVVAGAPITLNVLAHGTASLSYAWRKNGVAMAGATTASYTIPSAQVADGGTYTVRVSNGFGAATSIPAVVSVSSLASGAVQAFGGSGYQAGGTVTITNTLTYSGTATSLGWSAALPAGWSFASDGGTAGDVKPAVGTTDTLEWAWQTPPPSPVTFSFTVNVPADQTGVKSLTASAIVRSGGTATTLAASPTPLQIAPLTTTHSADSNLDGKIGLFELTRVIDLYNTRNGTTRTGCYLVDTVGNQEDGFVADPLRGGAVAVVLSRHHSADSNGDGQLSLRELTRVIELYNTRSGTTRTGAYHVQVGSEDGFAPGP